MDTYYYFFVDGSAASLAAVWERLATAKEERGLLYHVL